MGSKRSVNNAITNFSDRPFNIVNLFKVFFPLTRFIVFDIFKLLKQKANPFNFKKNVTKKDSNKRYTKKFKRFHTLIVLLALLSCNKDNIPYVLPVEEGVEALKPLARVIPSKICIQHGKTSIISWAIDFWNDSIGYELFEYNCQGYPVTFEFVDRLDEAAELSHHSANAWYNTDKCHITIRMQDEVHRYDAAMVMAHELGHCIGFMHSKEPLSIMAPLVTSNHYVTSELVRLIFSRLEQK